MFNRQELDRYITGNYGEDQFRDDDPDDQNDDNPNGDRTMNETMERDWPGQAAGLITEGWLEWTPAGLGSGIDEQAARESRCTTCDAVGLAWHGYQRQERRRGFAVCLSCDAWIEM